MNAGKILIGTAMLLLSLALMVTPSSAAVTGKPHQVGNGVAVRYYGQMILPGTLQPCVKSDGTGAAITCRAPPLNKQTGRAWDSAGARFPIPLRIGSEHPLTWNLLMQCPMNTTCTAS